MASDRLRAVVFALTLCLPTTAFAQQQPSAADREQARGLMETGDSKRDKGDLPGALEAFQRADGLVHVPTTGLEVARVQQAMGKLVEARDTAARVAKLPVTPKEPGVFKEARKQADALATELAGKIATLAVIVTGADSYSVSIDGETASNPETPKRINPGRHTIVAKGGGNTASQDVTLGEGENKKLPLELKASVETVDPPPNTWSHKETTESNETGKALMWGGFGVGGVGVVVGAITGILSLSKVSDVKPDCPGGVCPASRQADIDSAKTLGTVSTISFIVGGIGIGVGIAGVVMSKNDTPAPDKEKKTDKDKEARRIEPILGLGYAGLRGTF